MRELKIFLNYLKYLKLFSFCFVSDLFSCAHEAEYDRNQTNIHPDTTPSYCCLTSVIRRTICFDCGRNICENIGERHRQKGKICGEIQGTGPTVIWKRRPPLCPNCLLEIVSNNVEGNGTQNRGGSGFVVEDSF
jgi:hypothetical protein